MSLPRGIMQVVIVGSTIVGRAFYAAGRQVIKTDIQSSEPGGSTSAATGGSASRASANAITRRHKMTLDEAYQILNVRDVLASDSNMQQMLKNYEIIFKQNEETTHYLQSKVVRARGRIEAEIEALRAASAPADPPPNANPPPP